MLFGARTVRTQEVLGEQSITADGDGSNPTNAATREKKEPSEPATGSKPRKGHGRNGAADYPGAAKIEVGHPALKHGDRCPGCCHGKVYPLEPAARL